MCSQISRQLADHQGALFAAVTDVAENSLFAFADASSVEAFEDAVSAGDGDWLHAVIRFAGPAVGCFELTIPRPLARRLCTAFSGAASPEDVGDADLWDFTGELANMLCGAWLTRSFQHELFDLTPPRVGGGPPDRAIAAEPANDTSGTFYLAIDDTPIRLEICWTMAEPSAVESR